MNQNKQSCSGCKGTNLIDMNGEFEGFMLCRDCGVIIKKRVNESK